jgi:cell pole-organizing protein PopZ
MSASQTPPGPAAANPPGGDPSMEDILASIRRILSEDEAPPASTPPGETPPTGDDVLVLDPAMMVSDPAHEAAPVPEPPPHPIAAVPPPSPAEDAPVLVAPETAAAAAHSVDGLVRALTDRTTRVRGGGPTIEDLVREELRPLLKAWLDANLPPLVERLVRAEIERVVGRAVP